MFFAFEIFLSEVEIYAWSKLLTFIFIFDKDHSNDTERILASKAAKANG